MDLIEKMEQVRLELDRLAEGKRTHRVELESPRYLSDYDGVNPGRKYYMFTVKGVRTDDPSPFVTLGGSDNSPHTITGCGKTLDSAVEDYLSELKVKNV